LGRAPLNLIGGVRVFVYTTLKDSRDRVLSVMGVLITATGLRGKKPLTNRINVIKGSRQNKHVTSGKMLAPKPMSRVG